jgi:DNA uptake protein ComE-like DNA-binding protein
MADDPWKEDLDKKIDKANEDGKVDKELYDLLKKLLKAAKTAGDFAKALEKEGILKKLGSAKKLGTKAATVVIDILIQLVEAGPCPWTAVILARIDKLIQDAMLEDGKDAEERVKQLNKLKDKYRAVFVNCQKEANGSDKPKDVNKAKPAELKAAGIGQRLAKRILWEAYDDPFQTPNELLRVPGVKRGTVSKILESGFYFGISGRALLVPPKRRTFQSKRT